MRTAARAVARNFRGGGQNMRITKTRAIRLGGLVVGGGAPVMVQSMTNTDTRDVDATLAQIERLAARGCEAVRLAVPDEAAARALRAIRAGTPLPLIADIHFDYRLAVAALEAGVEGLRINPGNIGPSEHVDNVVDAAKAHKAVIRIGVNSGSLEKSLLKRYGGPCPEALVQSALGHVRLLERRGFYDTKISLKSSSVLDTITSYRLLHEACDYPLHIGVTEAGGLLRGTVKSSVGLGILLHEGIGDTLRVSLTADPAEEVTVAWEIRKSFPAPPAAVRKSISSPWPAPWRNVCPSPRPTSRWRSWAVLSTAPAKPARRTWAWPEAGTRA